MYKSEEITRFFEGKTISGLPCALQGVALGNIGCAHLISIIFADNGALSYASLVLPSFFCIVSSTALVLYWLKMVLYPSVVLRDDLQDPHAISTFGSQAMSLCLISAFLQQYSVMDVAATTFSVSSLGVPLGLLGGAVQHVSMLHFIVMCWQKSVLPEPFYNAAVHSCYFPILCLSGPEFYTYKQVLLCFGLLTVGPSVCVQAYRIVLRPVLFPTADGAELVVPNFSVCMMQNAFSISLRVWMKFPQTDALAVPYMLFALSTLFFLLTLAGIWQRRHLLYKLGLHKSLAASHFPFVLTATAAYQFKMYTYAYMTDAQRVVLTIWAFLLSVLGVFMVLLVDYTYVTRGLFIDWGAPPTSQPQVLEKELAVLPDADNHVVESISLQ